ncbi:gypsy type transposase, partial [Tanacetum coccineum]
FSPVADIRAIRILIAITVFYDYEIWQMDVKTAFLNGYLDEDIYPEKVCKLQRFIYGLKQASRSWNKRFDEEIKRFGFTQNLDEPCVYQKASGSGSPDSTNPEAELRFDCYCDAGFETDRDDTKYQTRYLHKLSNIAASEAAMEVVWIRKFILGLGIVPTINEPIKMFCDNSTALLIANEPGVQRGARHYHRRYHYVRESIELGEIKFLKVHTVNNLADPFMKDLPKGKLTQHARSMGLRLASSFMTSITSIKCVLTQEHLDAICAKYFVPEEVHPQLPSSDATMHERPAGKVGMYTRFFDYANYRIPFSTFFVSVLTHFRIPFTQLSVFGSAKVSHFEILCRVCNIEPDDRAPAPSEYNVEHVNALIAQASPFLRFPEEFLCWVGISRNYLLNKDSYPRFEYEDGEVMDLNAFIRTADPRKVRIVERPRAENEGPIVTVAKHRTVTLLPTSVVRSSGELSASVEREFVGDASDGGEQGFDSAVGQEIVEPFVPVATSAEATVPKPQRSKKKRVIYDSEGLPVAPHPPKRLRTDYGTAGGSVTGGKSLSALNRLLQDSRLTVEQGVPALPTLPFITSSVTASPLEEAEIVLTPRYFAGPEVDSLVRSTAPIMTEAITVATTVAIPADISKDKGAPHPSVFGSSSSSEKTDRTLSLFTGRSGSGFDAGSIRAEESVGAGSEEIYVPEWTVTKGFEMNDGHLCANMIDHFTPPAFFKTVRGMEHEQLFTEFNVSTARNLSLSSEVSGLEATENSLRGEVASAKDRNTLLEQECDSLKLKVTGLESAIVDKDHKLSELGASSSSLKSQNQSLVDRVNELAGFLCQDLREKLEMYEGLLKRLEEYQDELMEPLRTRLAEIDTDFTRCCMRFQENFHPHLLNVIAGRRWLLTHGMKLLMVKCLNSNEYMEALGHAFGRAIEKGMQEGLAAGIEHGQAGRCLTDLEAYIPSAEDDFNSAIRELRDLNFPLLQELSTKKDAVHGILWIFSFWMMRGWT